MGTLSTKKFIKNNSGTLTEEAALLTSSGVGDANKIPALNANGVLDTTIVNSTTSSSGAGDSGKVVALDGSGKIDATMMPVGIGADVVAITASENLAAGDFVNVWSDTGTAKVRKADATTSGKEAHGFVLSSVTLGNPATVYFEGSNTAVSGVSPGVVYLSTTAGLSTSSVSGYTGGNVIQRIGFATSTTSINFQSELPLVT